MASSRIRPFARPGTGRGAASLVIVVILLAAMAIGVAYTNRNLVFEQRTAANLYREAIAAEAAEAGLEWALAMMNKVDTIGGACTSSTASGSSAFRDRYFNYNIDTGAMTLRSAAVSGVHVACISNATGNGWTCNCPVAGTATNPTATAPTSGYQPSFAIAFEENAAVPGTARIRAYGCTSPISSSTCGGDGAAMAAVLIGPIPTLGTPPAAPLTARGTVNFGGNATVVNGDPTTNGITVNAGLGITESSGGVVIETVPGTPPKATMVGNDPTLANASEDQMFKNFFNMSKADFQALSTVKTVTCSPCGATELLSAYNSGNGYRVIWVNGNLDMSAQSEIGTVAKPVLIVVDGNVTINAGVEIYGMVYSTGITWNQTGGGNALVNGAAISEGNYTGNGTPAFVYDARVLNNLRNTLGTYVRVPGSWRDYD